MPNYQTHSIANLILVLPLSIWSAYHFFAPNQEEVATFAGCFIYTTLFMSPDVDLASKNKLLSLKGILTLPFHLYARLFSHRGLSHMPVIGTLTRLLYLFFLFLIIYTLYYETAPSFSKIHAFIHSYSSLFFSGFLGACIADIAHEGLDFFDFSLK
ncbi:MAG: DUF2227 family putative metal-binding protein [Simkaniaceae bacterium]|nr:DUF2227 family putative metal-binding protein [Simkaniaceae bacterium]